ncbi:MAG: phosphoribosylamine--glycine ligase, partial [candidate division WOR-3 bacterium]
MKVLIIGSGGREHALSYWFHKFGHEVIGLPGNPGIERIGKTYNFSSTDFKKIEEVAIKEKVDVILPGPEEPIVKGIKNKIKNFFVYSPNEKEALLEGSKAFAKEFMSENGIPT